MIDKEFVAAFLRGDVDAPPDSWVHRENWLIWHRTMLPPEMLDREIAKMVERARRVPWAWESLRRLYNDCDGDPLPVPLKLWVDDVVNERITRPNPRGPKPDTGRHNRYRIAFAVLTEFLKFKRDDAIAFVAEATGEPEDTVSSVLRRGS